MDGRGVSAGEDEGLASGGGGGGGGSEDGELGTSLNLAALATGGVIRATEIKKNILY